MRKEATRALLSGMMPGIEINETLGMGDNSSIHTRKVSSSGLVVDRIASTSSRPIEATPNDSGDYAMATGFVRPHHPRHRQHG